MKKLKRILALSLSAVLLLALLSACGDPAAQGSSDPTGNPTGNPSGSPTQTVQPTPEPAPVDLAAFYVSLTEAKYRAPKSPEQAYPDDLASYNRDWEDVAEEERPSFEDWQQIQKEQREFLLQFGHDTYPSLFDDIATEQCLVYLPIATGNASEAVLVQVSKAADVDKVKTILQDRVDAQVNGGAWYPAVKEGWEKNSRIVSNGNYVMLIVSEDCDAIVAAFNAVIADPSYVPAPNPNAGNDNSDSGDSGDSGNSGTTPGFGGGIVIPGFGGTGTGGNTEDN